MDVDSTLLEYQIQLEQVEIALKTEPQNEELLRLKTDLLEVITLTKELIEVESDDVTEANKKNSSQAQKCNYNWRSGQKCMAIWRVDGKHYPATLDQVLEDGTCTVIFDGFKTNEITQVGQLKPYNKDAIINNKSIFSNPKSANTAVSQVGHKKAFTKKELELKLREAKKRKKEKFALKIKAMEEISEKEKNKWKNFNTKLSSKTWKGVVKKNKFETPDNHENKIGVGTNSLSNRVITANGTVLPTNSSASASAALASNVSKSRRVV